MTKSTRPLHSRTDAVYATVLLAMFVTSFVPEWRLWGLSVWSPLPWAVRVALLLVGLLPVLVPRFRAPSDRSDSGVPSAPNGYALRAGLAVALGGLLFILLAGRTHFLGDGYQLLSNLASDTPLVRGRNLGAMLLNIGVVGVMPGLPHEAALLAYRVVSIASGVIMLGLIAWSGARLMPASRDRWLWLAGIGTGGYALLFFGYVENYAFLIVTCAAFTLLGLLIARREVNRWFILIPLAVALLTHFVGLFLVPAAIYVLFSASRAGHWVSARPRWLTFIVALLLLGGGLVLFYRLWLTDYYFRFAFLPPVTDRFTLAGYTLFAPAHFADVLNLALLLFPWLPVFLAAVRGRELGSRHRRPIRFLLVLAIGALGFAFVLDPKLGMPRDWDLFAFVGIPLVVLGFYGLLVVTCARRAAMLTVMLGALALLPRAAIQRVPDWGIDLVRSYIHLDVARGRTGVQVLGQYMLDGGLVSDYAELSEFRDTHYPEEALRGRVEDLANRGFDAEAIELCRQIIDVNPRLFSVWTVLGFIYNNRGLYDSARVYLEIADGLNPDAPGVMNELGRSYFYTGRRDEARELWLKSIALDSAQYVPYLALARWHRARDEEADYGRYLAQALTREGAPWLLFVEQARLLAEQGDFQSASASLADAEARGADSASLAAVREAFPQLNDSQD